MNWSSCYRVNGSCITLFCSEDSKQFCLIHTSFFYPLFHTLMHPSECLDQRYLACRLWRARGDRTTKLPISRWPAVLPELQATFDLSIHVDFTVPLKHCWRCSTSPECPQQAWVNEAFKPSTPKGWTDRCCSLARAYPNHHGGVWDWPHECLNERFPVSRAGHLLTGSLVVRSHRSVTALTDWWDCGGVGEGVLLTLWGRWTRRCPQVMWPV